MEWWRGKNTTARAELIPRLRMRRTVRRIYVHFSVFFILHVPTILYNVVEASGQSHCEWPLRIQKSGQRQTDRRRCKRGMTILS